ncbi:DUF3617 domain-containing protein [Alcanivorax sp. JB21]|uniref:DUF3617 domain-containing protein n=1 Tax=Alcanivorax limicola TaxID=2874102 RepID=UPI001CBC9C04|nr:DUF3617 family protein [Alcanivorax limicola]MBZ2188722.1 DUF3617 domain-containing protein [Alcanivorax limicola]
MAAALLASGLLALSATSSAETPNVQPGEWEYTNVTRISTGGQTMPSQRDSHRECVTQEDITNKELFSEDMGECEITDKTISRSGMRYSMRCTAEEGMHSTMDASMKFMGNRVEGTVDGKMMTPMGEMTVQTTVEGKRLGDC